MVSSQGPQPNRIFREPPPFSHKVTITGSGVRMWTYLLRGHHSILYAMLGSEDTIYITTLLPMEESERVMCTQVTVTQRSGKSAGGWKPHS